MYVLYYSAQLVERPASTNILLCIADDTFADVKVTSELLFHSTAFNGYNTLGFRLAVGSMKNCNVPVITLSKVGTLNAKMVNCTQIYTIISRTMDRHKDHKLSRQELTQIKSKLIPLYQGNETLVSAVIAACAQQHLWELSERLNGVLKIDLSLYDPDFINQTKELIDCANANQISAFTADELMHNATCHQNLCTDKFYISIPSRESLLETKTVRSSDTVEDREIEADPHSFIPLRDSVCTPYESDLCDTPMYMKALGGESLAMSQPAKLRSIIGNPDNNGLPVQDNEIEYYTAMIKWIKFNIKSFYMQDIDTIDALSLSYMEALAGELYMWHWKHNIDVPSAYEPGRDSGDSLSSSYVFVAYPGFSTSGKNAVLDLLNFLKMAASECGFTVYPQAIIQLGRWGSRKGTQLQFADYPYVFDLGTNTVMNKINSKAEYALKPQNGKMAKFIGLVWDKTEIADQRIGFTRWPMPVGVALKEIYSSTDNEISVTVYYSMIDLIKEIVNGTLTIDGIGFNKEFQIDDAELSNIDLNTVFQEASDDKAFKYPIFRSQGLIDLYMNLNTNYSSGKESQFSLMSLKLTHNEILSIIDKHSFSVYSELTEIVGNAGNRKQVIDYMIVRDLIKVYHAVATDYRSNYGIAETINLWYQAVLNTGYVNESYFYVDRTNNEQPLPGTKLENASNYFWHDTKSIAHPAQNLTSFSTVAPATAKTSVSAKPLIAQQANDIDIMNLALSKISDFIIREPPTDGIYCKVMYNEAAVTVAVFSKLNFNGKAFKQFTILDENTATKLDAEQNIDQKISIFKLLPYVVHTMLLLVQGNAFKTDKAIPSQIFFNKKEAIVFLRTICQQIYAMEEMMERKDPVK